MIFTTRQERVPRFARAKDSRFVMLVTYSSTANRSHAWRIARDGSTAPVNLAAEERSTFWEAEVSPDGKWLAYQVDLPMRHTIWRIDLPR